MPARLPRLARWSVQPAPPTVSTAPVRQAQSGLSAAARGYGYRWTQHRKQFINELFRQAVPRAGLCGARLPGARQTRDSQCAVDGRIVRGTVADHIVPVTSSTDPTFYQFTALQLLCRSCHERKRQRESRTGGGAARAWLPSRPTGAHP